MISPGDIVLPRDESVLAFQTMIWEDDSVKGFDGDKTYIEGAGIVGAVKRATTNDSEDDWSSWSHVIYVVWPNCVGWSYNHFIGRVISRVRP